MDLTDKEKHLVLFLRDHPTVLDRLSMLQKAVTKPEDAEEIPVRKTVVASGGREEGLLEKATPLQIAMNTARDAYDMRQVAKRLIAEETARHEEEINMLKMAAALLDEGPEAADLRQKLENW